MSINPETLSLVAAGAIGIVGLYFFSSSSSDDGHMAGTFSPDNHVLPPKLLGIGSGISEPVAKAHGYYVDPNDDPVDSGVCKDNSGIFDPNESLIEKIFKIITIPGWIKWISDSVDNSSTCATLSRTEIKRDLSAAQAAFEAHNYQLAWQLFQQYNYTQIEEFGTDITSDPQWVRVGQKYASAYYTFVVCKAQLEDRRTTYKMACDSYNDTSVPAQRVVDLLSKIFSSTASMQQGALSYYTSFFDPDSDIMPNASTMYATLNTDHRGDVHYDASQNTTTNVVRDGDSQAVNTITAGIVTPNRSVSTQPTDEQMIRALVLASVDEFPALSQSYRDSMSMLKFTTLYAKMLPLRDAYARYMNAVQAYKTWQASAAEASDDVRAAVADGAAAYKQLPAYIVTDTVGIASALHVIDEDTRYRHPKFDTSLPGGQKVVGAAGRYYSGADCNYGGCQ